ncbi:MAG: IclR family transcriptional regulator, partial [Chloroflexi bacterium]
APAHCTGLGKAILAFLPKEERRRILKEKGLKAYTSNTITSLSEFEAECERIRERGFALDLGEHEEEIRCVAAPILDHTGYPIAALSVAIPAFRTSQAQLEELGPDVAKAAKQISVKSGYLRR